MSVCLAILLVGSFWVIKQIAKCSKEPSLSAIIYSYLFFSSFSCYLQLFEMQHPCVVLIFSCRNIVVLNLHLFALGALPGCFVYGCCDDENCDLYFQYVLSAVVMVKIVIGTVIAVLYSTFYKKLMRGKC